MNLPTTLAIDTSCDETSVSIVSGFTVLSNVLPSQMEYHKKYGGVVPSLAKLAHIQRIDNVVLESLKKSMKTFDEIDFVAVTIGPGLAMALEVGIKKAKELSEKYNKPLICINHMEGHFLSALAERKSQNLKFKIPKNVEYPVLGFLISGGHTEFVLMEKPLEYKKIGETLDDSCGEAYDKCGRILGFGYPAGRIISDFAKYHRKNLKIEVVKDNKSTILKGTNLDSDLEYRLPIAMANSGDLNFSYSGLKTAFRQLVASLTGREINLTDQLNNKILGLTKNQILDLCVVFEAAALKPLEIKLGRAILEHKPKEVFFGGGVVASPRLRQILRRVCKENEVSVRFPYSAKLTTDNAAMIGVAANNRIINLGGKDKVLKKLKENPRSFEENWIYKSNFDLIDRDPSLSF